MLKQNLVDIKFHGVLGVSVGKNWKLAVNSVGEAMRAIEIISKRKLFKFLLENDKKGIKYQVLINGRNFESEKPLTIEEPETIMNSELKIGFKNLKTIDIVPVLEGASGGQNKSIGSIIAGVILIIVGVILIAYGGEFLIIAGIGLIAGGVVSLLTPLPKLAAFQAISQQGNTVSYLFNGPQNVTQEGGPVPVGYGRLLIGSQVISASYNITIQDAGPNNEQQSDSQFPNP